MKSGVRPLLRKLLVVSLIAGLVGMPVPAGAADDSTENLPAQVQGPQSSWGKLLSVRQHRGGLVTGRLMVKYATGKSAPAEAEISISRNGTLVSATTADQEGRFQLRGLAAGEFIATAELRSGAIDFPLTILTHYPDATPKEMELEATLTPLPDGQIVLTEGIVIGDCGGCGICDECLADPLMDPCAMACIPCDGGFAGGGGGGGGGGCLAPLLGTAGLLGLLGLIGGDDKQPISPYEP